MTPKEKALELREKCDGYACYAEVAVNEIINAFKICDMDIWDMEEMTYWQEVKQEIEKL
jgi:hypothetical protein